MAITTIKINEDEMSVEVERDTDEFYLDSGVKGFRAKGEKGWLVAHLLQKEILKLMRLSLNELQEMRLQQVKNITD